MKWTTQAIVILGVAAVLTFQVGSSSAKSLSTDELEKTAEAAKETTENKVAESNGNHASSNKEDTDEVLKARLDQIREKIQAESKNIKQLEKNHLVKLVMAITRRLRRLRQEAQSIVDISQGTTIGSMAQKVVEEAEEALKKVRQAIAIKKETNPAELAYFDDELFVPFKAGPKKDLAKIQRQVQEVAKLAETGVAKEIAKILLKRLFKLQDKVKAIAANTTDTELHAAAEKLTKGIQAVIEKLQKAKLEAKKHNKFTESLNDEDDSEAATKAKIEEAKQSLQQLSQGVRGLVKSFDESRKTKFVAARILEKLRILRLQVNSIMSKFGHTEVGPMAKNVVREIFAAADYVHANIVKEN